MYRFNHPSAPNTRREQKPEPSRNITWKKSLAISALTLVLLFGAAFQSSNVPAQLQAILFQITGVKADISALKDEVTSLANNGLTSEVIRLKSEIIGLRAEVASLANKGARKFYLTKLEHNGAQALSACAPGYHMASLWEIHEPAALRYNTDLGQSLDDSGFGPPINQGWIRTAGTANDFAEPGHANCNAWTSADLFVNGTLVALESTWGAEALIASPWHSLLNSCSASRRVWCVQD